MARHEETESDMPEAWELPVIEKPKRLSADDAATLPAIIRGAGERAAWRFLEFFTANIRNKNARAAYARAVRLFCEFLKDGGFRDLGFVNPVLVAAYIEKLTETYSKPTVKQHLAAIRMLLDYLVTGGVLPFNPRAAPMLPPSKCLFADSPI